LGLFGKLLRGALNRFSILWPERMVESATGPWCLPMFLDLSAATGARRGEILALRWSDIRDGCAFIDRSLTQTKEILLSQ
jgi:integrase